MPIAQTIDAIDNPPDIADPANFEDDANDFLTVQLPLLQAQINTWAGEANTLASGINAAIAGGAFGIDYTFSTTTAAADPGAGTMRLNNATQNAATAMYLDNLSADGANWSAALDLFDDSTSTTKGYLVLRHATDGTKFLVFAVTGSVTDSTGYRTVTITPALSSAASPFANGDSVTLSFERTGDKGDTGLTGPAVTVNSFTTKASIVDADQIGGADSAAANANAKFLWSTIKAAIWTAFGALIAGGTSKSTPVDADTIALSDSAAANATKKTSIAELRAILGSSNTMALAGSATVFNSLAAVGYNSTLVPLSATLALMAYNASGSTTVLKALGISGTTITVGTAATIPTASATNNQNLKLVPLTATTAILLLLTGTTLYCWHVSVSGTTCTVAARVTVDAAANNNSFDACAISATQAFVMFAKTATTTNAAILSVSGTTITVNAAVAGPTDGAAETITSIQVAKAPGVSKVVASWRAGTTSVAHYTGIFTFSGNVVTWVSASAAATPLANGAGGTVLCPGVTGAVFAATKFSFGTVPASTPQLFQTLGYHLAPNSSNFLEDTAFSTLPGWQFLGNTNNGNNDQVAASGGAASVGDGRFLLCGATNQGNTGMVMVKQSGEGGSLVHTASVVVGGKGAAGTGIFCAVAALSTTQALVTYTDRNNSGYPTLRLVTLS